MQTKSCSRTVEKKIILLTIIILSFTEICCAQKTTPRDTRRDSLLAKFVPRQEKLRETATFGSTRVAYRGLFELSRDSQEFFIATPFNPYTGEYQEIAIPDGYVAVTNIFPWVLGGNPSINRWRKPLPTDTATANFYHTLKRKFPEKGAGYDSEYKILNSQTDAEEFLLVDLAYPISGVPSSIPEPFCLEKSTDFPKMFAMPRPTNYPCYYHCQSLYLTNTDVGAGINRLSKNPMCGGHTIVFAGGHYYFLHGGVKDIYDMLLYIKYLYGSYQELVSDNGTYNVLYNTSNLKYSEQGRKAALDVEKVRKSKNHIIGTTVYVRQN
jgi:hypothetical protein